ncbi:MAG: hypothetical protein U5K00_17905 [Melioribacteraceae bacterium]|nr:hypothetical protein [Melioribacteraceae bacterium]
MHEEINISTPNSGYMLPNNNAVIRFYSDFEVDLLTIEYSVNLGKDWETVNKSGYGLGDGASSC